MQQFPPDFVGEREVVLTRTALATCAAVFDALTDPEHVRRWFGLPGLPLSECDIDLKIGGHWRWVLRDPSDGTEHPFAGTYRDIRSPHRLTFTESSWRGTPGVHTKVITLTQRSDSTEMLIHCRFPSKAKRWAFYDSGLESCARIALDALVAYVPQMVARRLGPKFASRLGKVADPASASPPHVHTRHLTYIHMKGPKGQTLPDSAVTRCGKKI